MADGSAAGEKPKYLGNQTGQDFLDGSREFERSWLYTCRERGIWRLWWLIYCQLLGIDSVTGAYNTNQELKFVGSEQQYAMFRVQMARRFIKQREMMAKDQRPSFVGESSNNDAAALAQVNISTRAIEYMLTESKLEQQASKALTALCSFGQGGLMVGWDFKAGKNVPGKEPLKDPEGNEVRMPVLDEQTGEPVIGVNPETGAQEPMTEVQMEDVEVPSGAPTIKKLYPWQMAVDPYMEDEHSAVVTKTAVNKYELAAQFPELADKILACSIDDEMGDDALFAWGGSRAVSSDTVVLRQYFHKNCTAVPGGRWAGYLKDLGLWGVDTIIPCPLDQGLPVKFMTGPNYFGTAFGYPESGDLLALQQVLNEVISMNVTSIQKRGNANAYKRDDVQIDQTAWSMGGNLIDLPPGAEAPVWDEPPKMDSLSQYVIEFVSEQMRAMLGSNSVTEGNPDANISSGSFAVLLVNVAQKYASENQEAYDNALTGIANDALELTRKNAKNGFWASISGIGDAPYAQIVTNAQLQPLRSIKLVRQSPVLATFPGRLEVFDRLIKIPKRDRGDAADMMLIGRMEAFVARDQAAKIRIRKENEWLLQGINPVVTIWDDHATEGPEHRMEYDKFRTMDPPNPQADPQGYGHYQLVAQCFEQHLMGHADALAKAQPQFALTAGWAPLDAGGGGGGQQQQQQGSGGGGKPKPVGAGNEPKEPGSPKQPQAPKAAGGMGANT